VIDVPLDGLLDVHCHLGIAFRLLLEIAGNESGVSKLCAFVIAVPTAG
jgi:hypothetical protein